MGRDEIIPHLFKTEYRKIVSVLCKRFGFDQIETAEDIAGDTFLSAAQTWGIGGIPENPVAWLYRVAQNKAINYRRRELTLKSKISPEIKNTTPAYENEIDLSPQNIIDSQLQMMFAICHPSLSAEAQVGLSLRYLCGFGIEEIADAFLTSRDTINKRLFRAKEKLREEKIKIEFPDPSDLETRLDTVLTTLYLLFTEGYYSISQNRTLRKELCYEAMRLCHMLVENPSTDKPQANALLALMCFHYSRFEARQGENGELILYDDQDTGLWNSDLISQGVFYMNRSAQGDTLSKYHLEAAIAYWYTRKPDTDEKWDNILQLYNRLLQLEYSPLAALNRTYALSKVKGKRIAIDEAEKLGLTANQFYFTLLGELYAGLDHAKASENLQKALSLAKTQTDKQIIQKKIDKLIK